MQYSSFISVKMMYDTYDMLFLFQMYQMTAAGQLQGIPLTLPHQQAIGDAGGVVPPQAHHPVRLQYPPEPYRSNYAYLVNSMAGMNLNMCAWLQFTTRLYRLTSDEYFCLAFYGAFT